MSESTRLQLYHFLHRYGSTVMAHIYHDQKCSVSKIDSEKEQKRKESKYKETYWNDLFVGGVGV